MFFAVGGPCQWQWHSVGLVPAQYPRPHPGLRLASRLGESFGGATGALPPHKSRHPAAHNSHSKQRRKAGETADPCRGSAPLKTRARLTEYHTEYYMYSAMRDNFQPS
jgi:hypothetical protein